MSLRKSIGIALCRRNPNNAIPEILLIKAKTTYGFCGFTFGKYKLGDLSKYIELISSMTSEEKLIISTLDFAKIWYHIWLKVPNPDDPDAGYYEFYIKCRNKFEKLISKDNGKKLKLILTKTQHAELGWEIPKGRIESNESEIECGVREFQEETGVSSSMFHILYEKSPICHSYVDNNVTYVSKYYIAWTDKNFTPIIDYSNQRQLSEVTDICWCSLINMKDKIMQNRHINKIAKIALMLFKKNVK